MSKLYQRVWNNPSLTVKTKLRVCQACILNTLLYSSEVWTPYARQERRLNSFYLRCLRHILHISWQDRVTDVESAAASGHDKHDEYPARETLALARSWILDAFQRTSCTVSWQWIHGRLGVPASATKTCARGT